MNKREREASRILQTMKRLELDVDGLEPYVLEQLARGVSPGRIEAHLRKVVREQTGLVQRRKSRKHGVSVSVYEAETGGFDSSGGPYVTVCDDHGTICNHDTLKTALDHAPWCEWCEDCQEGAQRNVLPHPTLSRQLQSWDNPGPYSVMMEPKTAQSYIDMGVLEFVPGHKNGRLRAFRLTRKGRNIARLARKACQR